MQSEQPMPPEIVLVAIIGNNRVIGDGQGQPWHFKCDLRRFKAMTHGHPIILGRRTFQALGERPLPARTHIVMTRQANYSPESGVLPARTVAAALESAATAPGGETVFVIGGGTIYRQFLAHAQRIELTVVDDEPQGTVLFPELDSQWREQSREITEEDGHKIIFSTLRRIVL